MIRPASLAVVLVLSIAAHAETFQITGMTKVEAQQKEEAWCWAAVIQIVARAERVPLAQETIVRDVKGNLNVQSASFDEITKYLVGWHGKPGVPGTWTSDALAFRMSPGPGGGQAVPASAPATGNVFNGPPPAQMILRYFQIGRPMVLAYQNSDGGDHAVVAFGGDFEGSAQGVTLKSIKLYDPMTNSEGDEDWDFFSRRLIGAWFPTIELRDGCNTFTLGQPPDPRCQNPVQGPGVPMPGGHTF